MNTEHRPPSATELMNSKVNSVSPTLTLNELVSFLLKNEITCAPVVDNEQDQFLLGFVSEGDALSHLSNQMFGGFPRNALTVETMMKCHPIAVTDNTDLFSIASIFNSHNYRHVPVVDADHRLLGLISRREVLHALQEYNDREEKDFNAKHFPPDIHKIMNHRFIVSSR